MGKPIFNQKSIDRISTPEQLGDFLQVTTPAIWSVLAVVLLLLGSLLVWSSVTTVESYAAGTAEVRDSVLTLTFDDAAKAENVQVGMNVKTGDYETPVLSVGRNGDGTLFAVAKADLPNGAYEAKVGYRSTQIIEMLFN